MPRDERDVLIERIRDLELWLKERDETLEAIRRGEIDALVITAQGDERRVYTLEGADRPYRVLVEQMQEGAVTLGEDGTVLYCNRCLAGMLSMPQERVIGQKLIGFVAEPDAATFARLFAAAGRSGVRGELTLRAADGSDIPIHLSLNLLHDDDVTLLCGVLTDLREQKQHLRDLADANARLLSEIAERQQVEEALRQAQKMEAVGQLTGGIAHDFNNLLGGITGSLELMQTRLAQGRLGEMGRYIVSAQGAADRAAALTHRLLAFSRRQTLAPVPTNANRLVAGMDDLVRRTVGPAIVCETVLAVGLWQTLCDPHQLENALLNLAINARDAMPDGGRLTIETRNLQRDRSTAAERDMAPGHYVAVYVTDTGTGMTSDVMARAFDPFFTTKPIGVGTGLGLSMVYGFVRQSGGQVRICSQPGRGTTVELLLPRHEADDTSEVEPDIVAGASQADAGASRAEAGATVLVIDDEPTVRMLLTEVLEDFGYATIEAEDGPSGLRIVESGVPIDLLVTDVGLPGGLNGRQVAEAVRQRRPEMKVLFITGYADSAVFGNRVLEPGMQVMTKPFAMSALASRVQEMLAD